MTVDRRVWRSNAPIQIYHVPTVDAKDSTQQLAGTFVSERDNNAVRPASVTAVRTDAEAAPAV